MYIQQKLQAENERKQGVRNYVYVAQSEGYAVRDQTKYKHGVYSPLVAIGRKQFHQGRRTQEPIFLGAVATTNGEHGNETIKLQEFIVAAYGRQLLGQGIRDDGSTIQECTTKIRQKFRPRIITAVAKGHARMLNECGLPRKSCKKFG